MASNPYHSTAPCVLTIDLAGIASNFRLLLSKTSARVGAAIKANGYGTGLIPAFETLACEGCKDFFVATPDEAERLTKITNANANNIYVLGGLYHGAEDFYAAHNILPVLNSRDDISRWKEKGQKLGRSIPCAVHIDTGMNRLGLNPNDVPNNFDGLDIKLLMSHFACSDSKDHEMNERQAKSFAQMAARFPNIPKSLSNSSAIWRNKDWHYDVVRPGYALYGGNPLPEGKNPMRPVVSLHARILQTRDVQKGESAGYSQGHIFEKPTTIACVAIGYADGLPRAGSGRTTFYFKGQPCPVLGRISMDASIIDIGHLKETPRAGEWVEILGTHQDIDVLAASCGTIGYEILTSLGHRHHRIHKT